MSGGIFKPSEEPLVEHEESVEVRLRSPPPLLCPLCNESYHDPRVLQCYHTFCAQCLRGRANNGLVNCPLCGSSTKVQEEDSLPPSDSVLKFLVHAEDPAKSDCANCDGESTSMYFCTTCSQTLCEGCRRDTHRARMFASHHIVPLSHHCRSQQQVCAKHKEPYIMFSMDTHALLCINCFRDLNVECRANCVDLDEAYTKGCQSLEEASQSLRELQTGVQDGIWLLRGLLDELKQNSESEKSSINDLHSALRDQLAIKQDELMKDTIKQQQDKEREFREQLSSLNSLLPAIHTHIVTCTSFVTEATNIEFLQQGYNLIARLNAISSMKHPLQPQKSSHIEINSKMGFARCIEELLDLKLYAQTTTRPVKKVLHSPHSPETRSETKQGVSCHCQESQQRLVSNGKRNGFQSSEANHRKGNGAFNGKIIIVEAGGTFAEHCKEFEAKHREILQKFECVKLQVQELHRDTTQRKCMAKKAMVFDLKGLCTTMDSLIGEHSTTIDEQSILLEKHWEDAYQRVSDEQEVYQAQIKDAMRIKTESERLKRILKHLAPFIKSINVLCQKISPKLGEVTKASEDGETVTTILHQINSLEPDSQLRVDAIHKWEEDRQNAAANRTDPLVEELMKTKEILKSRSARKTPGMKRGTSFESVVKPKVTEIMTGSSAASPVPAETDENSAPEQGEGEGSPRESSPQQLEDAAGDTTAHAPKQELDIHAAIKKSHSLPLKVTKKRHHSRADSVGKKDGISLREMLHDEIVSWGEQRERQKDHSERERGQNVSK